MAHESQTPKQTLLWDHTNNINYKQQSKPLELQKIGATAEIDLLQHYALFVKFSEAYDIYSCNNLMRKEGCIIERII